MAQISEQLPPEIDYELGELRELVEEYRAVLMLKSEDVGWKLITGRDEIEDDGPKLEDIHKISKHIREMTVNPLIKRAVGLRQSYIWSKPPQIPVDVADPSRPGRKTALQRFMANPVNQRSVLNSDAHEKMELAVITDGVFLLLGEKSTKTVRPIPVSEIVDVLVHDDFADEIVAYKRRWSHYDREQKETITLERWIYVESVPAGDRADTIGIVTDGKDKSNEVDKRYEVIDFWANQQVGWTLGTADALAAVPWAQMYVELMQSGKVMTDALAKFAGRITNKTKAGNAQTGAKVSAARGSGKMATMAQGNEMEIFSSAGKTYDFGGIRPVSAMVATAMEVSIVHLLSDPGAAGSSYGSASNLDLPTKRAVVQRQRSWATYLQRVIKWATNQDVEVTFPTLDEPDPYREAQTVALGWQSGVFHPEEVRSRMATIANVELLENTAPEGVLVPNNINSLARRDIDSDSRGSGVVVGSPDQGVSNGTGGTDSAIANDLRSDTIENLLRQMDREQLREFLQDVLA